MGEYIDWTIRVRHQSKRQIMLGEAEKIDMRIAELNGDWENELTCFDSTYTELENGFSTTSFSAGDNMHEAMIKISEEFPEFFFQTEAIFEDHSAIQINYRQGVFDKALGDITYEPHHLVKF